jgi:WD40 repeat protein
MEISEHWGNTMAQQVFISYAHDDKTFAERLARDLGDAGLDVWIDFRRIQGGELWRDEIFKGIAASDVVVICLSPASVESEWVRREILMARSQHKRVVPVMTTQCYHLLDSYDETRWLSDIQIIDFEREAYAQVFPRLLAALPGVGVAVPDDVDPAAIPCPFKGLEAFQQADAHLFFGREDLVAKMLDRLGNGGDDRFLAVVGASGSGKSSVVRAGLIPALRAGQLAGSDGWPIVIFTPGPRPTEALATRLLPVLGGSRLLPEVVNILEQGPDTLHQLTEGVLADAPPTARLLLVVDQFEETFTRASAREAAPFLDLLRTTATLDAGRTLVVLTMRADFFDRLSGYPDLAELFEQENLVITTDMTPENLRRCIEGPAEAVGLVYDDSLPERILEDVRQQPGSLPLLEFALKELYERRDGRRLTLTAYEKIGGVRRALAQHAEGTFQAQDPVHRDIMRRVLLRMVEVSETGEATRLKVDRADLTFRGVPDEAVEGVIHTLTAPETRLLVATRDINPSAEQVAATQLEISHEALVREWERFTSWVAEDEEGLRYGGELLKAASEWERAKQHTDFLLHGARVDRALLWLETADANNLQRAYIQASITEHERQRRQVANRLRAIAAGLAFFLVVALLLSLWAFDEQGKAENAAARAENQAAIAVAAQATSEANRNEAWNSQALFLADLSRQELEAGSPHNALLLALESLTHYSEGIYHGESSRALYDALSSPVQEILCLRHGGFSEPAGSFRQRGYWWRAAWNADETRILSVTEDAMIRVWDAISGTELLTLSHSGDVGGAAWNADGTRILSWSNASEPCQANCQHLIQVWDAISGAELLALSHDGDVGGAAWNADGTRILSWSNSVKACQANGQHMAQVWDATSGERLFTLQHDAYIRGAVWNRDESRILTRSAPAYPCYEDPRSVAQVWDTTSGERLFTLQHDRDVQGAVWNRDGSRILSWENGDTARVWDTITGDTLFTLQHDAYIRGAVWNQDGNRIFSWAGSSVHVWDTVSGIELFTIDDEFGVENAALNTDATALLTWSLSSETVNVWDIESRQRMRTVRHDGEVRGAVWNRAGTHILSWARDGTIRVWQLTPVSLERFDDRQGRIILSDREWVAGATWSSDETRVLTWDGRVQVWNAENGTELINIQPYGVKNAVWNGAETRILSVSHDAIVQVWDALSGEELLMLQPESHVQGAALNRQGTSVLYWSQDGTARIVDVISGVEMLLFDHGAQVRTAAWNPDETHILTMGDDNNVRVWNATNGELLLTLGHEDGDWGVQSVQWNKEGNRILTRSSDGYARIWDAVNGTILLDLSFDPSIFNGAMWSADETKLLVWSDKARIYNATSGTLQIELDHFGLIGAVWNTDTSRVLTWSTDETARLWDAIDGNVLFVLDPGDHVLGMAWNSDETRIVGWIEDNSVRIWDATNGDELLVLRHNDAINGALWNTNGTRLLTWSGDGAWIWTVDVQGLIDIGWRTARAVRVFHNDERESFFLPTLEPTATPTP